VSLDDWPIFSDQDLHGLDLRPYWLANAILKNANLNGTDLTGTILIGADIAGADFRDASITREQAVSAKRWFLARWSPALLDSLELPPDHNERLESKNLRGYLLPAASQRS
jgi:uncharacterized protein YjbI with pentapeptide repeats